MKTMRALAILLPTLMLASCGTQRAPSAADPAGTPSLKDFDDAAPYGPLFMPFR